MIMANFIGLLQALNLLSGTSFSSYFEQNKDFDVNPCALKADGDYCTRNGFEYLHCKNHVATIIPCGQKIYDPASHTCVTSSKIDERNYCRYRPNGDYNWPWNCHQYVTCSNQNSYLFSCPNSELVYDPIKDRCRHPDEVKCKQLLESTQPPSTRSKNITTKAIRRDPCRLKADGKYCTRSSFVYMICKDHKASFVSCGNDIYDPSTQTCVASSNVNAKNYCVHRPNGDYNWPWNCHEYVTCSNHYYYLFNCSTPELVYDPVSGRCKHPSEVKCKEIQVSTSSPKTTRLSRNSTNPCQLKPDGKYCTRNSFEYMVCKKHVTSYVSCGNDIYDPNTKRCVSPTRSVMTKYCSHRPNGDYNWPWNCHKYVTCSNHYFYLFNCSRPELVYDSVSDRCRHPEEVKCKELKTEPPIAIS